MVASNILSDALPKTAIQKLSPALLFFFRQSIPFLYVTSFTFFGFAPHYLKLFVSDILAYFCVHIYFPFCIYDIIVQAINRAATAAPAAMAAMKVVTTHFQSIGLRSRGLS